MLCGKLSSCLCLLPWDGQAVITHKTISVRNFIATGGQQTTQVSQQSAKTSHVLTHPISLIQSQLILKFVMLFGTTACQSQLKISLKPSMGQDHWRHIHAFRGAQVWLLLTLQQEVRVLMTKPPTYDLVDLSPHKLGRLLSSLSHQLPLLFFV